MQKKILLIDDEKEIVDIIQRKIQREGYEVHVSYNGQEGLVEAQAFHPDLIMTDIGMPIMDGLSFCKELRNHRDICNIPVIVATAYGSREQEFLDLGARGFLVKPFDMKIVMTAVNDFFSSNK